MDVAAQVIVFLVVATLIGGAIGWLLAPRSADAPPRPSAEDPELVAEVARLEAENQALAEAAAEVESLRAELAGARWEISTLEEALGPAEEPGTH